VALNTGSLLFFLLSKRFVALPLNVLTKAVSRGNAADSKPTALVKSCVLDMALDHGQSTKCLEICSHTMNK